MISILLFLLAIYIVVIIAIRFANRWYFNVNKFYYLDEDDVSYIFVPLVNMLLLALIISATICDAYEKKFDISIKEKLYKLFK